MSGLDWVKHSNTTILDRQAAVSRLQQGRRLGGQPLTREQAHEPR